MKRLLIGLLAAMSASPLARAGQVELRVTERLGVPRHGAPVTSGVPIPKGELRSVENVRLVRDGREVPAQFRAAGLWRPDDSIRWLLVDFQADVLPNETLTYVLEYGGQVRPAAAGKQPVRIDQDADGYTVHTGPAVFRISKHRFSLFEEVKVAGGKVLVAAPPADRPRFGAVVRGLRPMATRAVPAAGNAGRSHLIHVKYDGQAAGDTYTLKFVSDGEYELAGERSGPVGRGGYGKDFTSTDGAVSIPADAWLKYAAPKRGDVYTFATIPAGSEAASQTVYETAVVESGPMRSAIRVKGGFGRPGLAVLELTAWYHFYADSRAVKLAFTLENNHHGGRTATGNANNANIGGINCVFFDEMVLTLPVALDQPAGALLAGLSDKDAMGVPLTMPLELYQDSSGLDKWDRYKDPKFHPRPNSYVSFKGYRVEGPLARGKLPATERGLLAQGDRAMGLISVFDTEHGLACGVADFWQNFPKSLAAAPDGTVTIGLFPGRYAGDFAFRSGEHKTHEVCFVFQRHETNRKGSLAGAVGVSEPLRAEPSAEWFARAGSLGRLHPFDEKNYPAYEVRNLSTIGIFPAGVRPGPSLVQRIKELQFFGWMDYGDVPIDFEAASGQWNLKYDLDHRMACQYARTLQPGWWDLFAAAARHMADIDIHHQPHYPGLHYVKGGQWAHSLHDEPGHRNPHRNYNHFTKDLAFGARGTADHHYLTGDWKARDACLELAENALAAYMSPQAAPDPAASNRMGVRGDACTLNRLLEGYLMTGEDRFLQRARWQIASCAFDGRPAQHAAISLWSSLFYMMALDRYVEMFPDDAAAKGYLLAHLRTLSLAVTDDKGIYYTVTPQPDGSVVGQKSASHYNIMAADALARGFELTGDENYLRLARRCFDYGVKHACWENGPATYQAVHSANGATHGQVFMAVDSRQRSGGR